MIPILFGCVVSPIVLARLFVCRLSTETDFRDDDRAHSVGVASGAVCLITVHGRDMLVRTQKPI